VLIVALEHFKRRETSDAAISFDLERAVLASGVMPPDVGEKSRRVALRKSCRYGAKRVQGCPTLSGVTPCFPQLPRLTWMG
jgi:hypothetical protein